MNEIKPKKSTKKTLSSLVVDKSNPSVFQALEPDQNAALETTEENHTIQNTEVESPILEAKQLKIQKIKVIRDNFSFPEEDYAKIYALKNQCLAAGVHVKKSELLRAGLAMLSKLTLEELIKTVEEIEKIRTGRPKISKKSK